jgi:hypothetical protein
LGIVVLESRVFFFLFFHDLALLLSLRFKVYNYPLILISRTIDLLFGIYLINWPKVGKYVPIGFDVLLKTCA